MVNIKLYYRASYKEAMQVKLERAMRRVASIEKEIQTLHAEFVIATLEVADIKKEVASEVGASEDDSKDLPESLKEHRETCEELLALAPGEKRAFIYDGEWAKRLVFLDNDETRKWVDKHFDCDEVDDVVPFNFTSHHPVEPGTDAEDNSWDFDNFDKDLSNSGVKFLEFDDEIKDDVHDGVSCCSTVGFGGERYSHATCVYSPYVWVLTRK